MPDWSYHPLFKPWLMRLPGSAGREFIHKGMSFLSKLPGGVAVIEFLGHLSPSRKLGKRLFNIEFASPIGLGGRIDPRLSGTRAFMHLGFGLIEIGPVTCSPRKPSLAPHFRNDVLVTSLQEETLDLEETIKKLRESRRTGFPLLIRLGPEENKDLTDLAAQLAEYSDLFAIGPQQAASSQDLLTLKSAIGGKPLLFSVDHTEVREMISLLKEWSANGYINGIILEEHTVLTATEKLIPACQAEEMAEALHLLKKNDINFPVITSGGVSEPADAIQLLAAGSELILLSGGYVLSGPGLPKRINEAIIDESKDSCSNTVSGWRWYWLFGLLILAGGVSALFFSMTRVILFYDEQFLQLSRIELIAANPNILKFMSHDRMTLAGTMISGGILYMYLSKYGIQRGLHWARQAVNIAAATGFAGILLFLGFGYFDWLHGLFWLVLLPFFILGVRQSKNALDTPASKNRKNHRGWVKSVYGQLCFVILGFSFVTGGVVISFIGATNVFVPTDIEFICMSPEQLNDLNERLIPVIAHDRAGFGSALFSVGVLVLMMALWGFQEGSAWLWRSFLYGGIPAFTAGILTHIFIGYTDFIHLLPAYFALFLYIAGLILSKEFLLGKGGRAKWR
ncbi:dihydroorotate dehydrogenase [Bacillus sp. T33-2]|uniref:dihydroorotate dehydrogenase n=1 Tax=Bacillus sp. T33-2 TaxID=2054168 RepID=UPI000C76553D|nr:dihydroorotate dehydrogenase [Bacillus sp. T33-2]PLR97850.1 dihydroorotate dehydrogenase [Bacillus sp. T33-2]